MAEQKKTWQQLSTREKAVGVVSMGVIVVVAISLISGVASAIESSGSAPSQQPTQIVELVTTYGDVQATEAVPFEKVTQNDAKRDVGTSAVTTVGVDGVRTKTFHATYVDGIETARELASEVVTTAPINEVTSLGAKQPYIPPAPTRQASNCDPNYSGCVPIASDVDCAGGSGNGPAYTGMVQVIGSDIYGLDRDGDGLTCE